MNQVMPNLPPESLYVVIFSLVAVFSCDSENEDDDTLLECSYHLKTLAIK